MSDPNQKGITMANINTLQVTDDNFGAEVEQAGALTLVDFWATWCGPCQMIAPVVDQLATEYAGKVRIAKLDTDINQRTAVKYNVRSIPMILFFKGGKVVDQFVGADPRIKSILVDKIQKHLDGAPPSGR
jgi:thioredoxin 1